MTIDELIAELKTHPGTMRVIVDGYEGGKEDLVIEGIKETKIILDDNKLIHYGPHKAVDPLECDYDEIALNLSRYLT